MILLADIGKSGSRWRLVTESGETVETGNGASRDDILADPASLFINEENVTITGLSIGIAGLSRLSADSLENFKQRLNGIFPEVRKILVTTDAALMAETVDPDSLIISLGSGSVVVHVNREKNIRYYGGWGTHWGDELSGWWWFRQLAREMLLSMEGRSLHSDLAYVFCQRTGCLPDRLSVLQVLESISVPDAVKISYSWLSEYENHPAIGAWFHEGWNLLMNGIPSNEIKTVYLQGGFAHIPGLQKKLVNQSTEWAPGVPVSLLSDLTTGAWNLWQRNSESPRSF